MVTVKMTGTTITGKHSGLLPGHRRMLTDVLGTDKGREFHVNMSAEPPKPTRNKYEATALKTVSELRILSDKTVMASKVKRCAFQSNNAYRKFSDAGWTLGQ